MSNVGLCSDGTAIVWGTDLAPAPAPSQGTSFVDVTTSSLWFYPPWGYYTKPHGLALRNDGQVVAWGNNAFGQCDVPTLPTGLSYIGIAEEATTPRTAQRWVGCGLGGSEGAVAGSATPTRCLLLAGRGERCALARSVQ
ncbi:MAG: hypothetical protein IPJ19_14070 [Planctomycetes bacterium]|nr:hypothetical protein [Planctomycetota bacterium]